MPDELPQGVAMPPARNAIQDRTCSKCQFFHSNQGGFIGVCIRYPPTQMMIGMEIKPGSMIDPSKPPQQVPVFASKFPFVNVGDGCGEFVPQGAHHHG